MTCPLCMFVVSKVKDSLSDPVTRETIHDRTTAACAALPEGSMRDACTNWANTYGGHQMHDAWGTSAAAP